MNVADIKVKLDELIYSSFLGKYLIRTWIYRSSTYVIDLDFDGNRYAFDIKKSDTEDNFTLTLVNRTNNNKSVIDEKCSEEASDIFQKISDEANKICQDILSEYSFYISVVIPVYNREKLLKKCIKSLNSQTLSNEKFEVIFVDDFSSDNSVKFIERNISKKINYSILSRPINSGSASEPRNEGIRVSKGRYLFFLDSDDYIYNYTLEDLYLCAEKNNSDVIYLRIEGDPGRPFGRRPFQQGDVALASISENHLTRSLMPSKMIKRKIITSNDIYFPIDIKVGEDRVFLVDVLSHSRRISIVANRPYYYLTNHEEDRLTHVHEPIEKSLDIVSRTFRSIYFSIHSREDKKQFFSIWMNSVVESYIKLRLRNRRYSIREKEKYIKNLKREFDIYKELHSKDNVYKDLECLYDSFVSGSFKELYDLCQEPK